MLEESQSVGVGSLTPRREWIAKSHPFYPVSKAGVVSLSETLYPELHRRGLGVSVVCPGFFPTHVGEHAHFQDERKRAQAERLMRSSPITAQDVARAVV
jgi:NAD(P)-dependent dehydrogenase (short-subunit alcohol dehydrogenase family)